jgi:hypothetical protein
MEALAGRGNEPIDSPRHQELTFILAAFVGADLLKVGLRITRWLLVLRALSGTS